MFATYGGQTSQNKNTLDFKIHCFEPSRYTFEKLSQTHSNNEKVILNNFGLSNAETKATLYSNADGSGLASLTKDDSIILRLTLIKQNKFNSAHLIHIAKHKTSRT